MSAVETRTDVAAPRRGGVRAIWAGNPGAVVFRGVIATKSTNWIVVLTGFVEPIFYLLSLGVGLGSFIGTVTDSNGNEIPYAAFIAPALLAVSAMNGAIYDSTWNVFFKMHFGKLYQGMLSTSLGPLDVALGEITLALLRGGAYGLGFLIIMQAFGLNLAWTAIFALPAVLLIAFGFASLGMGITSYLKTFQQMDWIQFALLPMFLLSATFYPLSVYSEPVQWFIQACRSGTASSSCAGSRRACIGPAMIVHVLYYLVMIAVGLVFTTRRLRALFLD